ncbi:MAG TPA: response regulator [Pirellulaceae bacterium]|nr:response regulator [Pirellulaceae bacterium]HMO93824.1 response regulator [Pirellulaceae bacterium]HMP70683.1 response regulator [Pirellulaceae bacterium]
MTSILVVDDCSVDRHLIGAILAKNKSWDLQFAQHGKHALEMLEGSLFDLVVTDLQMPQMDGLELVRYIRSTAPHIPVLLVTSKGSQEIAIEALRLGATNYSPKIKLARDLLATAKHVLEMATQANQNLPDSQIQTCFRFVLENDTEMIVPLIATLERNLPSWTESDRLRIGMAINEALSNAIVHGNLEVDSCLKDDDEERFYALVRERQSLSPFAERRVQLQAEYTDERIEVTVIDQGPGFDPHSVQDPCREGNIERLSGRGLLLIRSFMDAVRHNNSGNAITMIKYRNP